MSKKYQLLVFDWDGTLMDSQSEIVWCFQHAAGDINLAIPTVGAVHNVIGLGMQEAVATVFPDAGEQSRLDFVERYRHYYFHDQNKPQSELFDGVYKMLCGFEKAGYFLAVATGKGRRGLNASLANTGLDSIFHFSICVDEAHSKPHPQMITDTMDFLGVEKNDTLMIGDTEYDLQMAINANVDSVAVGCGAHKKQRLLNFSPKHFIDESYELESWLTD